MHIILTANHTDQKWCGNIIKRGQLMYGRTQLAAEIGITVQQLRTSLNKLSSTNEITNVTSSKGSIITITNYNDYQSSNQENNQLSTSYQPAINQLSTTTKECKNDKKESIKGVFCESPPPKSKTKAKRKQNESNVNEVRRVTGEYPDDFNIFWKSAYPRNGSSKKMAYRSWQKADAPSKEIITAAASYASYCVRTGASVAHATTWLNQERWTIDYDNLNDRPEKGWQNGQSKLKDTFAAIDNLPV